MKKGVILSLVVVLLFSFTLTACNTATPSTPEPSAEAPETPETPEKPETPETPEEPADTKPLKFGVVIKQTGNAFFDASNEGFQAAAAELGIEIEQRGPADSTAEGQIEIIQNFISEGVDCLLVTANDPDALAPALKEAMDKGIKVISWDSDVAPDARMLYVQAADVGTIGRDQIKVASELAEGEGQIAILSAAATATNQNTWIEEMKKVLEEPEYSGLDLVAIVYGDDKPDKSYQEAQGLLKSYPDLEVVIAPTTVGIAATGKAFTDAGMIGKKYVTGLALPTEMAPYIKNGIAPIVMLWNPIDFGYVSAYVAYALVNGDITGAVGDVIPVGSHGEREVLEGGVVNLGDLFRFTAENVDDFNF